MKDTLIRYLTPFIASLNNVIYGVLLYLQYNGEIELRNCVYKTFDVLCGSSLLFVFYLISTSKHMCLFYKSACWLIVFMHIMTLVYLYTSVTVISYIYGITIMSMFALILSTAAILGRKTAKAINQAYKRERR